MSELLVMTGGTGGIGAEAARGLVAAGHRLTIGARDPAAVPAGATGLPLDLADLASVRHFAAAVGAEPIDALVLNAGIQVSAERRSAQGF